jgi:hypothetical protein
MGRIILGFLKGGLLGAILGYAAGAAGVGGGTMSFALYAVIGGVVGLFCGKPLWRQETIFTPILKAIFGAGVGVGLTFLARKFLGQTVVPIAAIPGAVGHPISEVPALLGPLVGAVYGILVEVDDGGATAPAPAKPRAPAGR